MILELELSPLIFFPTLLLRSDFKSDILLVGIVNLSHLVHR